MMNRAGAMVLMILFSARADASRQPAAIAFSAATGTIIAATVDRVEAYSQSRPGRPLWQTDGPPEPGMILLDEKQTFAAVVDPVHDVVALVDLQAHSTEMIEVPAGPVAALYSGPDLLVLSRDAAKLTKVAADGSISSVDVPLGASRLVLGQHSLFVYSPIDGSLQELDPSTLQVRRRALLEPFASDVAISGDHAYFVYPRSGRMVSFSIAEWSVIDSTTVGAVPTDLAVESSPGTLKAETLAVADPGAKTVWRIEGSQSAAAAFRRGFLRGLLGLGLWKPRSATFPGGVDRLVSGGKRLLGYDSSDGSLYLVERAGARRVASDLGPSAFAITPSGIAYWSNGGVTIFSRR